MSTAIQIPPLNTPIADQSGKINALWSRFFVAAQQTVTFAVAPADGPYWTSTANATLTNETNLGALSPSGYLKISVGAGIATPSTTATIPATDLSGTIPDARFPSTLPALNASNLTALNATQLTSGTVPDARFPATLPALNGAALTALTGSHVTPTVVTKVFADSPYPVGAADETVLVDATGGAVTITLPTATAGRILTVKKVDASANAVTLSGTADGVVNPTVGTQYQSRLLQGDGTNWQILSGD